jgi:hypothetical protein
MPELFATRALLLQLFKRKTTNVEQGEKFSVPLHVARGGGYAWSESGQIPAASVQIVERAEFYLKMMTDRLEIAGDLQQDTSTKAQAERQILDFETKSLVNGAKRGLTFDLYGDGSGSLGAVESASAADTVVVENIAGIADNQRVDILLTADGTVAAGVSGARVRVKRSTRTLTLVDMEVNDYSELNTSAANYTVYRHGSYMSAIWGLQAWGSTSNPTAGNIGGIDRSTATNDFWCAIVHDNDSVSRVLEFFHIQQALDDIDDWCPSDERIILVHPTQWNYLAYQLMNQKRFFGQMTTLNGWAQAIKFGDKGMIVKDTLCPNTKAFVFDPNVFRLWQRNEGEWLNDGSILSRIQNYIGFEAAWFRRIQLVCDNPRALAVIEDLSTEDPS